MFSSIFPSIYSFLPNYTSSDIERSVANLPVQDREALAHEIASGMRAISSRSLPRVYEEGDGDVRDAFQQECPELGAGPNENSNDSNDAIASSMDQLNTTLDQCRVTLEAFEKKERFLWTRITRYRQLMQKREQHIFDLEDKCNQNSDYHGGANYKDDVENMNEGEDVQNQLGALQSKHGKDRESLMEVEEIYKNILAEMETLRRQISSMEEKMKDITIKREECQEFLIVSAELC